MFEPSLRPVQVDVDSVELRQTLPFRWACGTAALLMAVVIVSGPTIPWFLFVLMIVSTLFAFYYEHWRFDRTRHIVTYRHGLLFAYRSTTIAFDEIEQLELTSFLKGSPLLAPKSRIYSRQRTVCKLELVLRDGRRRTLFAQVQHNIELIRRTAQEIATLCGTTLVQP